jgi:TolA-binding protein
MAKTPLDRLTSLGEEVLGKASQNPAAHRLVQGAMQLRDRVDDLSKRVRGLEQMEKRLDQIEKRLAKLEGGAKKSSGSSKKTTVHKPTTAAGSSSEGPASGSTDDPAPTQT